jgi:phospholipid/cholesterol/gamma-HCH transport system ATP-binding protein
MKQDQENLLEVRDLRLKFDDKSVLDGVDFHVRAGEVFIIMGISGCGKSTLLSIILGLIKPAGGSVRFKDKDLIQLPREKLNEARRSMGMVFQNAALVSSMNVRDNIALPLEELTDKTAQEIDALVDQKLELVGLADAGKKMPSELSGGMQKRVGLARALALDPELVLFDEPSAGLDPINSQAIDELIIQLRDEHQVTSVVVTHEMGSAFAVASRMAFLHEGKIVLQGVPDEFRNSDHPLIRQFLSAYLGRAKNGGGKQT